MVKAERLIRTAFYAAAILVIWLSLSPKAVTPDMHGGDKLAHLLAYGPLSFLGLLGYSAKRHILPLVISLVALGILLEFVQSQIGRHLSLGDMLANTAGVLLAIVPARFAVHWLARRWAFGRRN
ncbi:MAG: VanZ family protein [Kiloniellales bacterium]|nr:VanZ family protein [Kiloniellales bacterium]